MFSLDLLVLIIQRLDWGSRILLACEDCSFGYTVHVWILCMEKIPITPYSSTLDEEGCYNWYQSPSLVKLSNLAWVELFNET